MLKFTQCKSSPELLKLNPSMRKTDVHAATPHVADYGEENTSIICSTIGFVLCFGGVVVTLALELCKVDPALAVGDNGAMLLGNGMLFLMQMAAIIFASLVGGTISIIGLATSRKATSRKAAILAVAGLLSIVALLLYFFLFAWAS